MEVHQHACALDREGSGAGRANAARRARDHDPLALKPGFDPA
jgi:hypothetical protein